MALLIGRRLFNYNLLTKTPKRHGYIVLVPEIGEDLPEKNPLLQQDGLPEFNNITIENCMAAIGKQTLEFESDIRRIEELLEQSKNVRVFNDILNPLEKIGVNLDMTWGLSKTLYLGNSSLMPTKSYLAIHERAKRARAAKYNSHTIYRSILDELKNDTLSNEHTRVIKKYALEGKLNGLHLDGASKAKLEMNLSKLLMERGKFKHKTELSTKKFTHRIQDPQIVRDFSNNLLENMSSNPTDTTKGPWLLTLQPHVAVPFMEYCPQRDLRWNVWQAMVSRGSGYGDKEYETSTHMEEIRFLRRDQANILGFSTFAEMSMETKMAGSVENVQDMLHTLNEHAKPAQEKELSNMYEFATERGFEGAKIELWDVAYWKRKQCKSLFEYDEQKFQEYFQLSKVLEGLFDLSEKLFNIKIKQRTNISTWHKDCKFYDVFEPHNSAPVAGFYFDPYARTNEKLYTRQNTGWMVAIQNHSRVAETKPFSALVFNFQPPTADRPSLLGFKDVQTLFHKFGQNLQHLLSRTEYSEVSGLSNIEWDAVEVCGHVMSHWLLNKSTIDSISCHYQSEDKLPMHMFESLVNVHKHGAGTELCRELYLSALDLELHTSKDFWLDIVKRVWPQYRSFPLEKIDSHPSSFTSIFCEEWAAAYYSQIWSRMIAADVYSAFHEVQGEERQIVDVGKRFKDTFLALGGSCHPSQVFRNFRGRDPSPKALLASLGLKQQSEKSVK